MLKPEKNQSLLSSPLISGFLYFSILFVSFVRVPSAYCEIGDALGGVASIISSASSMATAGINAQSNKEVNRIQAAAAVDMHNTAAEIAKALSTDQKEVAFAQTQAAVNINTMNQQYTTDRLGMQLNELRAARESQFKLDMQKLAIEREMNQARIDLAWKQADANYKLAKMTLNAELVAAGMHTAVQSRDSGSKLTVRKVLMGRDSARAAASAADAVTKPVEGFLGNRLVSSISNNANSNIRSAQLDRQRGLNGLLQTENPMLSSQVGSNMLARGSSPGMKVRIMASGGRRPLESDLMNFQRSVASAHGFARSRTSALSERSGHSGVPVSGRIVLSQGSPRPWAK